MGSGRRVLGLLLVGLAALASGCSTISVKMKGIGFERMNPATATDKGAPLDVFLFFLKSREAFEAKGLQLNQFLTRELRDSGTVPPFLKAHTVAVERLRVQPGEKDHEPTTFTVPKEAEFVGLVASFQDHDDDDANERWRMVLRTSPPEDWMVRFYVHGKRLEEKKPEVVDPPAVSPESPVKAK